MATNSSSSSVEDSSRPVLIPVRDGVWKIPEDNRPWRIFNEDGVEISSTTSNKTNILLQEDDGKNLPQVLSDAWNNSVPGRLFAKFFRAPR